MAINARGYAALLGIDREGQVVGAQTYSVHALEGRPIVGRAIESKALVEVGGSSTRIHSWCSIMKFCKDCASYIPPVATYNASIVVPPRTRRIGASTRRTSSTTWSPELSVASRRNSFAAGLSSGAARRRVVRSRSAGTGAVRLRTQEAPWWAASQEQWNERPPCSTSQYG